MSAWFEYDRAHGQFGRPARRGAAPYLDASRSCADLDRVAGVVGIAMDEASLRV